MGTSRGRSFAAGSGAAVILILGGAALAFRETIRELWTIHFELPTEDELLRKRLEGEPDGQSRQRAAIEWLEARRSVRAAPRLLEIAGWEHSRRVFKTLDGGLSIPQMALRGLRSIPVGEDWYIARLRSGGEGERLIAIRRLAELGSRKSVPHLASIAREEGPPGYVAAAAMAQVLPSLTFDGMVPKGGGGMVGRFRLRNPAPRSVWFEGYSLEHPIHYLQERGPGGWVRISPLIGCGTGIEDIELPPGASTSFEIALPRAGNPLRAGVRLINPPPPVSRAKTVMKLDDLLRDAVWSPEIMLAEPAIP